MNNHRMVAFTYRLQQALAFALPHQPPAIPDDILRCLLPGTIERFRELPAADQRHLLAVGQALRANGAPNDCWIAGFLHDIGKTHEGCQVRPLDRGLWVIAARIPFVASIIHRQPTMPRFGRGLWIAAHHATIGGAFLRDRGYPERVCTLVAHHEDDAMAENDSGLRRLRAADDATGAIPNDRWSEGHGFPA